jgi:hypothetical protein
MNITTLVLNPAGEPHFEAKDKFDFDMLREIAKDREQNCLEKGSEFTMGAVTFFGGEVINAVNTGEHNDVTKAIIQMLMATWLFDSLYCGVKASQYQESDMTFTISDDGTVAYKRVPCTI